MIDIQPHPEAAKKQGSSLYVMAISCALSVLLLVFPGGIIRGYVSVGLDVGVSMLSYFGVVYWLSKRYPAHKLKIMVSFVVTLVVIYAWTSVRMGEFNLFTLPNFMSFALGSIFGYVFCVTSIKGVKNTLLLLTLIFGVLYYCWGIHYWLNYINDGTFTGRVTEKAPLVWQSYIEPTDSTNALNNSSDLILLDFFNTGCGVCFKLFPVVQQVYDKYKGDERIAIYAVDIPLARDTPGMALQLVRNRNYTFPVLIGKKGLDSLFRIDGYPTTFILKGDSIIFRGNIEDVNNLLTECLAP